MSLRYSWDVTRIVVRKEAEHHGPRRDLFVVAASKSLAPTPDHCWLVKDIMHTTYRVHHIFLSVLVCHPLASEPTLTKCTLCGRRCGCVIQTHGSQIIDEMHREKKSASSGCVKAHLITENSSSRRALELDTSSTLLCKAWREAGCDAPPM